MQCLVSPLYWLAVFSGELGLLLAGGFGRTVGELVGGFLGALFGIALLMPQQKEFAPAAPRRWAERVVLRQRWERLTLLTVLAVMIAAPFWLEWRDGTPGVRHEGYSDRLIRLAVRPSGKRQLLGVDHGRLMVWDRTTENVLRLPTPDGAGCAAFAPDGLSVVTGNAGWIRETTWFRRSSRDEEEPVARLWDTESGKQVKDFKGHRDAVRAMAFAPTGSQILTASDGGTMRLWDVASGLEVRRLKGYGSRALSVAISPDGGRALSGHVDGSVRVWDLDNEEEVSRFERHRREVTAVAFAPDGRTVFSGSLDGTVRRWDATTGRQLGVCRVKEPVHCLAVSQDGLTVLTGGDEGTVQLCSWPRP